MKIYIDRDDWWVGLYRGPHHLYICLLPCVVIRIPREARIPRRYRKYQAPLPDMSRYWNQPNMAAWLNAHRYRKYRPYVLGCVLAFMLVRRLRGR